MSEMDWLRQQYTDMLRDLYMELVRRGDKGAALGTRDLIDRLRALPDYAPEQFSAYLEALSAAGDAIDTTIPGMVDVPKFEGDAAAFWAAFDGQCNQEALR